MIHQQAGPGQVIDPPPKAPTRGAEPAAAWPRWVGAMALAVVAVCAVVAVLILDDMRDQLAASVESGARRGITESVDRRAEKVDSVIRDAESVARTIDDLFHRLFDDDEGGDDDDD